jgi:DNA-binding transcriptional MerR regulator
LNLYSRVATTYTIGQDADGTDFTMAAVRYYEGIGLIEP